MKYSELANVYSKLSQTTKRLEKTGIIAEFLKNLPEEDLDPTILLLQGRVFARWDKRTLGISSKLAVKAVAKTAGVNEREIQTLWRKKGDLGLVTEDILKKHQQATLFTQELTIKEVFSKLQSLESIEGTGSVSKKLSTIQGLLSAADPTSVKYLLGTILEELRVGVAEGVIRDAIVWAYLEPPIEGDQVTDRETYTVLVEKVQGAYDRSSDFAKVARAAKNNTLEKITFVLGQPIRVMLAQRETSVESALERVGRPAALEYKYDGFRCISGHTPMYTQEKGLISVKDVKQGMHVLTHKGRFRQVLAVQSRVINNKERVFSLQSYLGHRFFITAGHELLVYRKGSQQWLPVEELDKKDELFFPIPSFVCSSPFGKSLTLSSESGYYKKIPVNAFFFRFLGYWLGDGFTNEFHNTERVGLVFNQKDIKLCDEYKRLLKNYFSLKNISENVHNGARYLYWRDKPLRIWLSEHFRREWKGKFIPEWFQGISKKQFQEFLKGWVEADGHTDAQGRTSITTKERDVAQAAQLLALRHRILIGVKKIRVSQKTYYRLTLNKSFRAASFTKDGLRVRIHKFAECERPDPRMRVYNLQVRGDESYCTTFLTLHNCQIHKSGSEVRIFTRRLEEVTEQFPEVVKAVNKHIKAEKVLFDAEAVGFDAKTGKYLPFQSISQRIRRKYDIELLAKKYPVELCIFDVLYLEEEEVLNKPFEERRELLRKILPQDHHKSVRLSEIIITQDTKEGNSFYKTALELGNEGLMAKNLAGVYKPGSRVGHMVKIKPTMDTLDLVIIGAEWGEGKRAGWFTSFTLACADSSGDEFFSVGKVGTGLKELDSDDPQAVTFEKLTNLLKEDVFEENGREVKLHPRIVLEIKFEEIQKSPSYAVGYALRFPRVVGLREDRGPEDISTVDEVEAAFRIQRTR